jgi:hypothetical protein
MKALGELLKVLALADPADKAEVYSRLGLTLIYHPEDKRVIAEMRPEPVMYVGKCPRPESNQLHIRLRCLRDSSSAVMRDDGERGGGWVPRIRVREAHGVDPRTMLRGHWAWHS